jgi:hypothetical protein
MLKISRSEILASTLYERPVIFVSERPARFAKRTSCAPRGYMPNATVAALALLRLRNRASAQIGKNFA